MNKTDLREAVNPTFLTGQQTLFMLAASGNEDAKCYIQTLGLDNGFMKKNAEDKSGEQLMTEEEAKQLMTGVMLAIEGRYNAVSRELTNGKYRNMLDIACGYTPRSLFCYKAGIDYVGVDLPVVAEKLSVLDDKLFADRTHPSYIGGDATNAASIMAAADLMDGELFISSEGLTAFFSHDEMIQFTSAIRAVLQKHGGAWYSTDFGVEYSEFGCCLLESEDAKERFIESRKKSMGAADVYDTGLRGEEMKKFIEKCGFRLERIPFYVEGDRLNILHAIPEEKKAQALKQLAASAIYKITPDPEYKMDDDICGAGSVENLEVQYTKKDGVLKCTVKGRIDSLSAPALLEVFQKNYDNIESIEIDAHELEYISSAGLRVLKMAVKKLGQHNVRIANMSPAVSRIFDMTGFDNVIEIIR